MVLSFSSIAEPVLVQTELTPNQSLYDPTDTDLVDAALMMQVIRGGLPNSCLQV